MYRSPPVADRTCSVGMVRICAATMHRPRRTPWCVGEIHIREPIECDGFRA